MRIVLDTNVIISALVFGGPPRQVLDLVALDNCSFYFSTAIQEEVHRVLSTKFGWTQANIDHRAGVIWGWGIQTQPQISLAVVKDDPGDDRILECALAAEAQAIITGDRHLIRLGSFRSIPVQTPRQFLESKAWLIS